jgi:predicted small secreted protein
MVKRIILGLALLFLVFFLASCQTVQGIGNDITWMGEAGAEILEQ